MLGGMESSNAINEHRRRSSSGSAEISPSPIARKRSYSDTSTSAAHHNDETDSLSQHPEASSSHSSSRPAISSIHRSSIAQDSPQDSGDAEITNHDLSMESDARGEDFSTEPHDPLQDFGWPEFMTGYHKMIESKRKDEEHLSREFQALCKYFEAWAETSSNREVDRSYKRLKTQEVYVQHQEEDLESRRKHYVKVVTAFKKALSLLNA